MALDRYSNYPCSFVHGGGTLSLTQNRSLGIKPNANKDTVIPAGALDPGAVILTHGEPQVSLATADLGTVLAALDVLTGLNCTSGATFRWQKRSDGGTFASGSSHLTLTSTKGFLAIAGLTGQQDQASSVDLEYWPLYDGSTEPLVINVSQSLSGAPAPAHATQYYMGPVYLGSTPLDGVISHRVTPGMRYEVKRADGDVWARVGAIVERRPAISFEMLKADWLSTVASLFNTALGSALKVYHWKGVHGGSRVAVGSGAHCKITAAAGAWNGDDLSVSDTGDGMVSVAVQVTGTLAQSIVSTIP